MADEKWNQGAYRAAKRRWSRDRETASRLHPTWHPCPNAGGVRRVTPPPVLAGRYVVGRAVGRGEVTAVHLAEDRRHGRVVAVKLAKLDSTDPPLACRLHREIEIAAGLNHPNILPLYDSGATDDVMYFVMPFVEGRSLRDRLFREQRLALPDAIEVATEVGDALGYAHARGVIHRDIKPANVLISGGHAVVADFGIARVLSPPDDRRRDPWPVGTPEYMSPEQCFGTALDARSDLYSLGCMLFELLAGHPPFTATSCRRLLALHAVAPIPTLRMVRCRVPRRLENIIRKALSKERADRFQSAAEFVEALRRVRCGRTSSRMSVRSSVR